MAEPFLSVIRTTDDGYLVLREQEDLPALLESAEALWIKLHPHLTCVTFDSKEPSTRVDAPPPPPLEQLQCIDNLCNQILPILEDIDKMQDKERFIDRESKNQRRRLMNANKLTDSEMKVKTLERQQEAFQGKDTSSNSSVFSVPDASLKVCKALNSIRLLFPVLVRMLNHESRHDAELEISGRKLNQRQCRWILGDYVYDIWTTKNVNMLEGRMKTILKAFVSNAIAGSVVAGQVPWENLLPMLLKTQRIPSTPANPRVWLTEGDDDEKVMDNARRHDPVFIADLLRERTTEDQHEQFLKAVERLKSRLIQILAVRFRGATLDVYGSCLSDLSLGKSSDVDLSLHLPRLAEIKHEFQTGKTSASTYEREIKRAVFAVEGRLGRDFNAEFRDTIAITRARVPVVKGRYLYGGNPHTRDGSLNFDICFFNDIAVVNSRLLRDYTLVDNKAKLCMLAIKAWTRDLKINSAADNLISSYAWMNLVIFYLQCIGFLPNLQCPMLMKKVGFFPDPKRNSLHFVNALNTAFVPWEIVDAHQAWVVPKELKDLPLSVLVHGFFHFYAHYFPKSLYAASIRVGEISIPKTTITKANLCFFCIEDPFETFDSHYPHDLGAPANEKGQELIYNLIADNEAFLRGVLLGKADSVDGALWELPGGGTLGNPDYQADNKGEKVMPNKTGARGRGSRINRRNRRSEDRAHASPGGAMMETTEGGEKKTQLNPGRGGSNGQTVKRESIGGDEKKSPKRSEPRRPPPSSEQKTTNGTRLGQNRTTETTSGDHQRPQNTNRPRPSPRKPLA
jgi:hypothetical protein